ncbi:MAG: pabA [Rickettsiaceae bacterium]|jgi:anthranilate synthase component 2|nr:pabA [Rickettsiaceae bacterium]
MILLIDNYDSFTYNLLHYLSELGAEVKVVRNDALTTDEILNDKTIKGIVISPGPCTPNEAGICLDLIKDAAGKLPIFGVCLGHEAIGQAFGGDIVQVEPMHGKVSEIFHDGKGIFKHIPSPFKATRYHSLVVAQKGLPDCLEVTAHTADGLIMALQHKQYEIHGVQFHPESIASEYGHEMLKAFLTKCNG